VLLIMQMRSCKVGLRTETVNSSVTMYSRAVVHIALDVYNSPYDS
jgi:hypothetical protein